MQSAQAPESSATTVYSKLRSAIIAGELVGGSPLRQAELGARYGVSKIPVREALRQLEAQGFVTLHAGRGAVVVPLSAEEAEEVYLMRIALEPILLARSAPALSQLDIARADATLNLIGTLDNLSPTDWHALDGEFHALLYQAALLPRIQRQVETLRGNLARYFAVFQTLGNQFWNKGNEEHRAMLDACRSGKIAMAANLLTGHLERSSAELLNALQGQLNSTN